MSLSNDRYRTNSKQQKKTPIVLASIERKIEITNKESRETSVSKKRKKGKKRAVSSFPQRPYPVVSERESTKKKTQGKKKGSKKKKNNKVKSKAKIQNNNPKKIKSSVRKMEAIESYYKRMIRRFTIISLVFLFLSVVGFLILGTQYQKATVDGKSMEPTLYPNDKVLYKKNATIDRFSIVVFPPTENSKDLYVKRVIGMPGETIYYKDDTLYVNNLAVEEPYIESIKNNYESSERKYYTQDFELEDIPNFTSEDGTIPDGYYLVLGDNRDNSTDSRMIGLISEDLIRGVVRFRYSPLSRIGFI